MRVETRKPSPSKIPPERFRIRFGLFIDSPLVLLRGRVFSLIYQIPIPVQYPPSLLFFKNTRDPYTYTHLLKKS